MGIAPRAATDFKKAKWMIRMIFTIRSISMPEVTADCADSQTSQESSIRNMRQNWMPNAENIRRISSARSISRGANLRHVLCMAASGSSIFRDGRNIPAIRRIMLMAANGISTGRSSIACRRIRRSTAGFSAWWTAVPKR